MPYIFPYIFLQPYLDYRLDLLVAVLVVGVLAVEPLDLLLDSEGPLGHFPDPLGDEIKMAMEYRGRGIEFAHLANEFLDIYVARVLIYLIFVYIAVEIEGGQDLGPDWWDGAVLGQANQGPLEVPWEELLSLPPLQISQDLHPPRLSHDLKDIEEVIVVLFPINLADQIAPP